MVTNLPAARSTYRPHAQPPTPGATLPSVLPRAQATWQGQCADLILSCCHKPSCITLGLYWSSAASDIFCRLAVGLSPGSKCRQQLASKAVSGLGRCLQSLIAREAIRSNKYTGRPTRLSLTLQPARSPELQSPATISISCMVTGAGLMLDLCLLRAKPHHGWIRGSPTRGNVFSDRLMGSLPPLHNQWFCGTDAV